MTGRARVGVAAPGSNVFGRALSSFFHRIYCINLDSRQDRWRYVSGHLASVGLGEVERFSAIDVRNDPKLRPHERLLRDNFSLLGMCGCMLSHRRIIELAKAQRLRNVLVFEDDVRILEENVDSLDEALAQLEKLEWDVFYLGATYLFKLELAGDVLVRVANGAYATHAIAYNHTIYDQILNVLPAEPEDYLASNAFQVNALDKWLQAGPFDRRRFYGTNPIMAVQGLQESDIAFNQMPDIERTQIELFYKNVGSEQ
jgi:GR25 family glycosyltransferase involved in LPS biosynthesis